MNQLFTGCLLEGSLSACLPELLNWLCSFQAFTAFHQTCQTSQMRKRKLILVNVSNHSRPRIYLFLFFLIHAWLFFMSSIFWRGPRNGVCEGAADLRSDLSFNALARQPFTKCLHKENRAIGHEMSDLVTSHAVETGTSVADTIIILWNTLTFPHVSTNHHPLHHSAIPRDDERCCRQLRAAGSSSGCRITHTN